jgi:Protein of unknown function (DUF1214)
MEKFVWKTPARARVVSHASHSHRAFSCLVYGWLVGDPQSRRHKPRSRLKCILAEPEVLLTHIGTIKSGQRKSCDGYFIPNALKRQVLGDRDKLQFNPDGSVDLYIEAETLRAPTKKRTVR